MGGPQPYIPVGLDDKVNVAETVVQNNPTKRARVLCSYDAADATELNLTGNEVRKIYFFLCLSSRRFSET